jgi:alkylhydroperoxidase family enzyme
MSRIPPLEYDSASVEARAAHDRHQRDVGRITNMKRTLLHSLPAFHALMEWYPLRDAVRPFLGERLTHLFAHAVSTETDCLICSTFFRRLLIESGDDPDAPVLSDAERTVVEFGHQLGRDAHGVSSDLYAALARLYSPDQIVALTAFGAIMLATNVFNNALRVDLDG